MKLQRVFVGGLAAVGIVGVAGLSVLGSANPAPMAYAHGNEPNLADVADEAIKSIVNISTTRIHGGDTRNRRHPFRSDPFFKEFFGETPGGGVPRERREQSLGSGVIVSKEGVIVTNHHVIDGATGIRVTLHDGREFEVEMMGTDPRSDIAVLKITDKKPKVSPIAFGNSDTLRLAETVLAIGNPFGVGQTVTKGIVSAKGRANVGIVDYEDFIQTDAAINPGNSGGALVSTRGELVGINTAIVSRGGGNQGVGFAIPSNMVESIMESLIETGTVERGWLGVRIQDVDQDLASALGIENVSGVLIAYVEPESPASDAGLKAGDLISKVDGEAIESTGGLRNAIAGETAGTKIKLDISRNGKAKQIKVTLGALRYEDDEASAPGSSQSGGNVAGLQLEPLSETLRKTFAIPDSVVGGVVVVAVQPNSRGDEAGLRPGNVILQAARRPMNTAADFVAAYRASDGPLLLLVANEGRTHFAVVQTGKEE